MHPKRYDTPPRTLRDARPGERLEVRLTLFEYAEAPCWAVDLEVGDRLHCLDRSPAGILVAHPNGKRLRVPEPCARFVAVQRMEAPSEQREGEHPAGGGLTDLQPPF